MSAVFLVACVNAEDVACTRAANDCHCSEDDITLEEPGGTSYRAKGCGYNEVYDCSGSSVAVSERVGRHHELRVHTGEGTKRGRKLRLAIGPSCSPSPRKKTSPSRGSADPALGAAR